MKLQMLLILCMAMTMLQGCTVEEEIFAAEEAVKVIEDIEESLDGKDYSQRDESAYDRTEIL